MPGEALTAPPNTLGKRFSRTYIVFWKSSRAWTVPHRSTPSFPLFPLSLQASPLPLPKTLLRKGCAAHLLQAWTTHWASACVHVAPSCHHAVCRPRANMALTLAPFTVRGLLGPRSTQAATPPPVSSGQARPRSPKLPIGHGLLTASQTQGPFLSPLWAEREGVSRGAWPRDCHHPPDLLMGLFPHLWWGTQLPLEPSSMCPPASLCETLTLVPRKG